MCWANRIWVCILNTHLRIGDIKTSGYIYEISKCVYKIELFLIKSIDVEVKYFYKEKSQSKHMWHPHTHSLST